jgi:uncharacterized protein YfeS
MANRFDIKKQNSDFGYDEGIGGLKTLEERAREQSKNLQEKYMNNQRKNAKLFEDDSEEGNASLIQEEEQQLRDK